MVDHEEGPVITGQLLRRDHQVLYAKYSKTTGSSLAELSTLVALLCHKDVP